MVTTVTQFLETFQLYEEFRPGNGSGAWWNGQWPEVVKLPCHNCGEDSGHRLWPTKLAGFTIEWGVYMVQGTCERCGRNGVIFWIEVNQHEGWMRKAGQLPAAGVARHATVTT